MFLKFFTYFKFLLCFEIKLTGPCPIDFVDDLETPETFLETLINGMTSKGYAKLPVKLAAPGIPSRELLTRRPFFLKILFL